MAQIARGQASDSSTPLIDVYVSLGASLVDPAALEFAIDDRSTEELEEAPLQIFPPAGWQAVDLADAPGGDRLSLGHFVAAWTPELDASIGAHRIRWRAKLDAGEDSFVEWEEPFQIVQLAAEASTAEGYTTVARMRAEGLPAGRADDARVLELIEEASRDIDEICGWWFAARERTLRLDGSGVLTLELPAPPIKLAEVALGGVAISSFVEYGEAPVEGPGKPYPRLERASGTGYWPRGQRNVTVRGVFGYTEPDGTEFGRTPRAIRRACELMVLRGARPLDQDADERWRGRVVSQRTNRQSITLSALPARDTAWDQDPEISRLLARYRRPASVRGA